MNEFEFIKKIAEGVPRTGEGLICGIDDDAAVIEGPRGKSWLITTDVLTEGIHFKREWSDWETIGKKALLVNISDIAAMGGTPWFYFVSIACPSSVRERELLEFFSGMKCVAQKNDMILAGGDTTASDASFFVSITVVGTCDASKVVHRSGAKVGDKIFTTGNLGDSAAGLICLQKKISTDRSLKLINRHLVPEVRLGLAVWLAENKCANAMIDISDGLKGDIQHIADLSHVGYKIYANKVPIDKNIADIAGMNGFSALDLAVSGGEDYELLFTMSASQEKKFFGETSNTSFGCQITEIGEIISDGKVREIVDERGVPLHFSKAGFVHKIGSL